MNISKAKLAVQLCGAAGVTPMLWGHRGIGKSQGVKQITTENFHRLRDGNPSKLKWGFIDLRLSQCEAPDIRGLPEKHEDDYGNHVTRYLPPAELPHGEYACCECGEKFGKNGDYQLTGELPEECPKCKSVDIDLHRGIAFLDEINRSEDDVLQASFQLVLDRAVGMYTVPSGWMIACAGNYMNAEGGNYVVNNFTDEAFLDRFCHLNVTVGGDAAAQDWTEYMVGKYGEQADRILQFVGFDKKNLMGEIKGDYGFTIKPSPRAWDMVARVEAVISDSDDLPQDVRDVYEEVIAGLVGQGLARGYLSFSAEVVPKDILDRGVTPFSSKLSKWKRPQLAGLTWGIVSNAREHSSDKKIVKNVLDFMQWLCAQRDRDLAVMLGRQLVGEETQSLGASVISNENLRRIALRFKQTGDLGGGLGWMGALNKRKDLADLMQDVAWGKK